MHFKTTHTRVEEWVSHKFTIAMADDWVCCTNCNLLNTQYIRVPEYEFQSLVMLECSRKCSCESLSDSRNRAWLHPCQCDPAVLGEYDKLRRYFCYIGPNWSQNKCRQLLIALISHCSFSMFYIIQWMIFDFCQCHVGCRRSNKQFISKSGWVQCLSGPSS